MTGGNHVVCVSFPGSLESDCSAWRWCSSVHMWFIRIPRLLTDQQLPARAQCCSLSGKFHEVGGSSSGWSNELQSAAARSNVRGRFAQLVIELNYT